MPPLIAEKACFFFFFFFFFYVFSITCSVLIRSSYTCKQGGQGWNVKFENWPDRIINLWIMAPWLLHKPIWLCHQHNLFNFDRIFLKLADKVDIDEVWGVWNLVRLDHLSWEFRPLDCCKSLYLTLSTHCFETCRWEHGQSLGRNSETVQIRRFILEVDMGEVWGILNLARYDHLP